MSIIVGLGLGFSILCVPVFLYFQQSLNDCSKFLTEDGCYSSPYADCIWDAPASKCRFPDYQTINCSIANGDYSYCLDKSVFDGKCQYSFRTDKCIHISGWNDLMNGGFAAGAIFGGGCGPFLIGAIDKRKGHVWSLATISACGFLAAFLFTGAIQEGSYVLWLIPRMLSGIGTYSGPAILPNILRYVQVEEQNRLLFLRVLGSFVAVCGLLTSLYLYGQSEAMPYVEINGVRYWSEHPHIQDRLHGLNCFEFFFAIFYAIFAFMVYKTEPPPEDDTNKTKPTTEQIQKEVESDVSGVGAFSPLAQNDSDQPRKEKEDDEVELVEKNPQQGFINPLNGPSSTTPTSNNDETIENSVIVDDLNDDGVEKEKPIKKKTTRAPSPPTSNSQTSPLLPENNSSSNSQTPQNEVVETAVATTTATSSTEENNNNKDRETQVTTTTTNQQQQQDLVEMDPEELETQKKLQWFTGMMLALFQQLSGLAATSSFTPVILQPLIPNPILAQLFFAACLPVGSILAAVVFTKFFSPVNVFIVAGFNVCVASLILGIALMPGVISDSTTAGNLSLFGVSYFALSFGSGPSSMFIASLAVIFKLPGTVLPGMAVSSSVAAIVQMILRFCFPIFVQNINKDVRVGRALAFFGFAALGTISGVLLVFSRWLQTKRVQK